MHWYRLKIWITLLTNQHVSSLINPHELTLYLPIRKICSNYPILLRLSTIQKSGSFKGALKMKICRSYKKIELEHFNRNHSYAEFEKVFLKELNKYAPLKKKIIRHNIMLLWQKNCGRKFGCDQNSRINLTRETINVLTIAVILSEAFVIDSKYIKMTGLQNFH